MQPKTPNDSVILAIFIVYLCTYTASCQDLALRQSQWYFWTKKCGAEFRAAMVKYGECAIRLKPDQTCEKIANDASLCYIPFENFNCSDEKMTKEVRLMGRREKSIQNTVLCKLQPILKENCISKLDPDICRPPPDNTLDDICSSITEINLCLKNEIEKMCELEEQKPMEEYLDVVSNEVICLGYTPKDSGATTVTLGVPIIFVMAILTFFARAFES